MGWTGRIGRAGTTLAAVALLCLGGCNRQPSEPANTMATPPDFEKLTDDFTHGALALSPVVGDAGRLSRAQRASRSTKRWTTTALPGIDAQRRFYQDIADTASPR